MTNYRSSSNGLLGRWAIFVHRNALFILTSFTLALLLLCLMSFRTDERLDSNLISWVQRSSRIEQELDYVVKSIKDGTGSMGQLLIQTPRELDNNHYKHHHHHNEENIHSSSPVDVDDDVNDDDDSNLLTVDAFMIHLEAMAIATHVTVDLDEVTWSLKDICFTPTLPDFDGPWIMMMDSIMPCAIKTPLDCFWEGAKILGPEQPIRMNSLSPPLKWTSINPIQMVEMEQANHPHASVPYQSLIDWMRRVGISTGYQYKPCLDPTDPNCPLTAPNKRSGEPPNIGHYLRGGCHGLATKQMHWHEDEIIGDLRRNKSTGDIISARGLQSTIQLMGEKDMYELWRKSVKVQDINNWSVDKAKKVLDLWQQRFKQELQQFTRTSNASKPYKIHAMTSDSMLEPISSQTLKDPTNFFISFTLMTIMSCLIYPSFNANTNSDNNNTTDESDHYDDDDCSIKKKKVTERRRGRRKGSLGEIVKSMKHVFLAIICSIYIGLIFIASLGLCLFVDLPINMATSQLLPPIALYYGFSIFNTIIHIYSEKQSKRVKKNAETAADDDHNVFVNHGYHLTRECLHEFLPVVSIQTISYLIAFTIATTIPVPATRVLALQAIICILIISLAAILILPPIMILLLEMTAHKSDDKRRSSLASSRLFTVRANDLESGGARAKVSIEDQIFSRIQDDLNEIRASSRNSSSSSSMSSSSSQSTSNSINFSAQLEVNGLRTSFRVSAAPIARPCVKSPSVAPPPPPPPPPPHQHHQVDKEQQKILESSKTLPGEVSPISIPFKDYSKWHINEPMLSSPRPPDGESEDIFFKEEPRLERSPIKLLTTNKLVQAIVITLFAIIFALMISFVPKIKNGLSIKDIVLHESPDYEAWSIQEEQFPVYNIFAITKGNFDYPNNQKLLIDYYESLQQVDGMINNNNKSSNNNSSSTSSKFWLIALRSWLLELQEKFDLDRNRSAIDSNGWEPHADDASKLAYKLLAQTGRVDNPIDKNLVETNRLVDSNNIINPRAFYYYLSAWIAHDPFSYATTEANFEPEPKAIPGNPDDLKMDKARPIISAHIPFQLKLHHQQESSSSQQQQQQDNMKKILEIRRISQSFEQLGLPNYPIGLPLIFWDQFINISLLFYISLMIGALSMLLVVGMITSDCKLAAIVTIPAALTVLELYGYTGYANISFNNVFAFLILTTLGASTVQTIHFITYFINEDGNLADRTQEAMKKRSRVVVTNLLLSLVGNSVFYEAKVDFMTKYSSLLLCLGALNLLKSILLTPVLLSLFGSKYNISSSSSYDDDDDEDDNDDDNEDNDDENEENNYSRCHGVSNSENSKSKSRNITKTKTKTKTRQNSSNSKKSSKKRQQVVKTKRNYPRVQSEISLSTISEEPQSEAQHQSHHHQSRQQHHRDLTLDLSIRCY